MAHKFPQAPKRVNVFFNTKVSYSLRMDFIFVGDELGSTNLIY